MYEIAVYALLAAFIVLSLATMALWCGLTIREIRREHGRRARVERLTGRPAGDDDGDVMR